MNFRFFSTLKTGACTLSCFLWLSLSTGSTQAQIQQLKIPDLGDSTSAFSSPEQEYALGQSWLRAFRRQAPILDDPLIFTYLHNLISRLAYHSLLGNKKFSLLVVDSPAFNAFAVPGNVIGVNTGLLNYAETEDQLASVLAHELAHLSQRHYARSMQQQQSTQAFNMAALLGSLLILASGNAEAGIAALTATQAAAISDRLKYSRLHEQEADRIGMQTLAKAGMNPAAAAYMFQHMLLSMRYREDIKEYDFLLTHPLTDSRVADAFNQARSYPARDDQDNFNFHLAKARIYVLGSKNPEAAIKHFKNRQRKIKFEHANSYGLALAYLKAEKFSDAKTIIDPLYRQSPHRKAYVLAKAKILEKEKKFAEAISLLQQHLSLSPYNYPYSMALAELFLVIQKPNEASKILLTLTRKDHQDNPNVWYLLAESEGLAGNIDGVHLARAEYFIQVGALTQALRHLNLALPLIQDDFQLTARTHIRIKQLQRLVQSEQF